MRKRRGTILDEVQRAALDVVPLLDRHVSGVEESPGE